MENNSFYDYAGVVHIHSRYSDGMGEFPEIIKAAKRVGADFLICTDHNTLLPLYDGWEGWREGVLVLVGEEISTPDGHYLALRVEKANDRKETQEIINEVVAQRGMGFLAHPYSSKRPWRDWSLEGYIGMEIINLDSMLWESLKKPMNILKLFIDLFKFLFFTFPIMKSFINIRPHQELAQWDLLNQKRKVVGIGSIDAHAAVKTGSKVYSFPSYEKSLNTVYTHLLLAEKLKGEGKDDKEKIYHALSQGKAYVAFDVLASPVGFRFWVEEESKWAAMGDTFLFNKTVILKVTLPKEARISLYRNGEMVEQNFNRELIYKTNLPGVYRVEVEHWEKKIIGGKLRPWIYSNPIYLVLKERENN